MAYLVWTIIGVFVAVLLGAVLPHRSMSGSVVVLPLAGVFGALLGGIIGSGIVHADHAVTLPGALGAILGAVIFVLLLQTQPDAGNRRIGRGNPGADDF
ncbi:hypothetical protein [Roseiflexus sp.]|uniref:hypothetical protein n=1 Tax=Roseiflexus sp. TaxID=2562120 RepID=UPI0021DDB1C0|nr:hypothetical protein [Roseiflexus sp.]GIV99160.1 MAG: hypothetical protein KatS3mg058_0564 [Roseiflexus sp.]